MVIMTVAVIMVVQKIMYVLMGMFGMVVAVCP